MYLLKKTTRDSKASWLVCIPAAFFFFFDFLQMGMINTLRDDLMTSFAIKGKDVGTLAICFSTANWLFLFPAGAMIDRYSTRRITLSMFALSVVAGFGTALAIPNFWLACTFRFLAGAAHAFCFLCCVTLVNRWFTPKRAGFAMGVVIAVGLSGIVSAQTPLKSLVECYGLRNALLISASTSLVALLVAIFWVQDYPSDMAPVDNPSETNVSSKFRLALRHKTTWLYALFVALLNAPYMTIGILYLATFLQTMHQSTEEAAVWCSTLFFIGNMLGGPLSGFISERWRSRKKPMLLGASLAFASLLLLLFCQPLPSILLGIVCFMFGVFISAQVISYPAIGESNPPAIAGAAMSITSFVVMGSIPIFQWILRTTFQYLNPDAGQGSVWSQTDYLTAFSPILLALIGAIIIAVFVRDTYGKPPVTPNQQDEKESPAEVS